MFSNQNIVSIYHPSHECYMPRPSHPPWFNHPYNIWWSVIRLYDGSLKNSWTHLITQSRNFVGVRWRSLLQSTSLGKRCTSYNAPPTSRKRTADRWSLRNLLPRSSLFMVGKAQKSHWIEFCVRLGKSGPVEPHQNICHTVQISPHAIAFS
jgi:hypothetical protein